MALSCSVSCLRRPLTIAGWRDVAAAVEGRGERMREREREREGGHRDNSCHMEIKKQQLEGNSSQPIKKDIMDRLNRSC